MGKASRQKSKAKLKAKHFNFDIKLNNYYLEIDQTLKHEFDSSDQKELFVRNVLKQLASEAVEASENPSVCPIVEKLFKMADEDELYAILNLFSKNWEKVCCSKTISFATQTLLRCCNKYLDSPNSALLPHIDSLKLFLLERLAFYMQHTSASHIIRTLIEVLSGINCDSRSSKNSDKQNFEHLTSNLSIICKQHLNNLCVEILNLPKLEDHIQNNLSCPVLQSTLKCSHVLGAEVQQQFCRLVLKNGMLFDKKDPISELPINVTHPYSSRLVETWLTCIDDDLFRITFKNHFKNNLFKMAEHDTANFILIKLLEAARNEKQFGRMYKEIESKLEGILACNHLKVIIQIAENCIKFNYKQSNFIKKLETAFHCDEPATRKINLFRLLLTLSTFENYFKTDENNAEFKDNEIEKKTDNFNNLEIQYFGSQIVQTLLKFSNPNPILSGLKESTKEEIMDLCKHVYGSHVVEEFLKSTTISAKNKLFFFEKLKDNYVTLACDKMGSRTFDCIWKEANLKLKKEINEELSLHEDKLKRDKFGYFIHSKCAIGTYKKRLQQWTDLQKTSSKKQKLFNNFLDSEKIN